MSSQTATLQEKFRHAREVSDLHSLLSVEEGNRLLESVAISRQGFSDPGFTITFFEKNGGKKRALKFAAAIGMSAEDVLTSKDNQSEIYVIEVSSKLPSIGKVEIGSREDGEKGLTIRLASRYDATTDLTVTPELLMQAFPDAHNAIITGNFSRGTTGSGVNSR